MKNFVITLLSIFLLSSNKMYAQFSAKDIAKVPLSYQNLMETHENEKGFLMSYKKFKKGNFEAASQGEKLTLMTTMLLGSATYLYNYLQENEKDSFTPLVLKPNGFTTTVFQIEYKYAKGSIFIMRKLLYANIFLNSFAAEDPNSYGLLYGFDIPDKEEKQKIITLLKEYFAVKQIAYQDITITR
jgi:hypothetical protein